MQMRPEIQITSVIKSIKDVLIPAIDPSNKLAIEQSQLIIGLLSLLARQLPVQFRFDRDELTRLLATAETLEQLGLTAPAAKNALSNLSAARTAATTVLARCQGEPAELVASVRELRERVGAVVLAVNDAPDVASQLRVEEIVLDMSEAQLLRDRALMKMQGWEPDPARVPDLETLIE